ncbi:pentapeptide repeat-containing protein [Streptomyces aureocirculatus]|uniref:hypothetical protein n=1 Tax=Streptomyces aureocirculatus TaxID=67275 RepID=UPI000A7CA078|nr:hypothetical protein [Streptomyces aureocirculatus]
MSGTADRFAAGGAATGGAAAAGGAAGGVAVVDLDESGWPLRPSREGPRPVPAPGLTAHLAERLTPPPWATDIVVYVHGWQTSQESALGALRTLLALVERQRSERPELYPALAPCGRGAAARVADVRGADVRGAYGRDADARDPYGRGADARDAYGRDAHVPGADARDAHGRGADARDAYVPGAEARDAHVPGAGMAGTRHVPGAGMAGAGRGFVPWAVLVRWPSRSLPSLGGYRRIRDRAHAMGTHGHAARVIGQLLGYLDEQRGDPRTPPVLANRGGQYLRLVGHSFGCRFLCEAVQWAAAPPGGTLGWSTPVPPGRPFTVDSMLLLQMAAPRDAFAATFTALAGAPLRGPVVATYSQHDRATGFWHLRAERRAGIGYAGIGTAPAPVSGIRMRGTGEAYPHDALDHRFVSVDAGEVFVRGRGPAGAHSDHLRLESAHLLLSLAEHAR